MDYIGDDKTVLEADYLTRLAAEAQLKAFKHKGFLARGGHFARRESSEPAVVEARRSLAHLGLTADQYLFAVDKLLTFVRFLHSTKTC